jgi:iron complex transport system ATP-binding protein
LTAPTLRVSNLSIHYGSRLILDNLSFEIEEAGIFAILGKNGSGKSSILKTLNGEIPYSGEIFVGEKDLKSYSARNLAQQVSYLPQKLELGINMTLRDLVWFGRIRFRKAFAGYSREDESQVDSAMEKFGLAGLGNKLLSDVSGGERQLAWLAQILAQETPIIIMDEPTLNLDLGNRKFVFETLKGLCLKEGKRILIVTHEIDYLEGAQGYGINLSENSPSVQALDSSFLEMSKSLLEADSILQ